MVVFRTEGGPAVGLGHIRRSMTLAQELQRRKAKIHFIVRQDSLSVQLLAAHGFDADGVNEEDDQDLRETVTSIARLDAHVVVVDSYKIKQVAAARSPGRVLVAIDDLAEAGWLVETDLIVNGSVNAEDLSYPSGVKKLLGPDYLLLREEFSQNPERHVRDTVQRVLISVGGADKDGITATLIKYVRNALPTVLIDVVLGPFFDPENIDTIQRAAQDDTDVTLHISPANPRALMLACDIAISGGGQTACELAAAGTPALAIMVADNTHHNMSGLESKGALLSLGGAHSKTFEDTLIRELKNLAGDTRKRAEMSRAGRALIDGLGAKRVAQAILGACSP